MRLLSLGGYGSNGLFAPPDIHRRVRARAC